MCNGSCGRFAAMNRLRYLWDDRAPSAVKLLWLLFLLLGLAVAALWIYWEASKFAGSSVLAVKSEERSEDFDEALAPVFHVHNTNRIRKSYLRGLGLLDDAAEHSMFLSQYVDGRSKAATGDDSNPTDAQLKVLMRVKLKLTQMLLEGFKYLKEGAHGCQDSVLDVEVEEGVDHPRDSMEELDGLGQKGWQRLLQRSLLEEKVGCSLRLALPAPLRPATLVFDAETWDYDDVVNVGKYDFGAGLQLRVAAAGEEVTEADTPHVALVPGHVTKISVSVSKTEVSRRALEGFSPNERGCYARNEDVDGRFSNCHRRRRIEAVRKACNCRPPFAEPIADDVNDLSWCHGLGLGCARSQWIGSGKNKSEEDCPKSCEAAVFAVTNVDSAPFHATSPLGKVICLAAKKLDPICSDLSQEHRRFYANARFPKLCDLLSEDDNVDAICSPHSTSSSSSLQELRQTLRRYADENIVILSISRESGSRTTTTTLIEEYPTERFAVTVLIILAVTLGFNLLSLPELLVQAMIGCCCSNGRRRTGDQADSEEQDEDGEESTQQEA